MQPQSRVSRQRDQMCQCQPLHDEHLAAFLAQEDSGIPNLPRRPCIESYPGGVDFLFLAGWISQGNNRGTGGPCSQNNIKSCKYNKMCMCIYFIILLSVCGIRSRFLWKATMTRLRATFTRSSPGFMEKTNQAWKGPRCGTNGTGAKIRPLGKAVSPRARSTFW